jgi:anti-sigma factor (TIGR02949 family)
MNRTMTEQPECSSALTMMDRYMDAELDPTASGSFEAHLASCEQCAGQLEIRRSLRTRLRSVVKSEQVPFGLHDRILANLEAPRRVIQFPMARPLMAIAAAMVITVGSVALYTRSRPGRGITEDSWIASVSHRLAHVMQVGMKDHLHCAVLRKYPKDAPKLEQAMATMPDQFRGLAPVVQKHVPSDFKVRMAHKCGYAGREYIHLVLKNEGNLISLVIADKRPGEDFDATKLKPALVQSGIDIYSQGVDKFQIAGFESDDRLIFVVSDLSNEQNNLLMANMSADVQAFLKTVKS